VIERFNAVGSCGTGRSLANRPSNGVGQVGPSPPRLSMLTACVNRAGTSAANQDVCELHRDVYQTYCRQPRKRVRRAEQRVTTPTPTPVFLATQLRCTVSSLSYTEINAIRQRLRGLKTLSPPLLCIFAVTFCCNSWLCSIPCSIVRVLTSVPSLPGSRNCSSICKHGQFDTRYGEG